MFCWSDDNLILSITTKTDKAYISKMSFKLWILGLQFILYCSSAQSAYYPNSTIAVTASSSTIAGISTDASIEITSTTSHTKLYTVTDGKGNIVTSTAYEYSTLTLTVCQTCTHHEDSPDTQQSEKSSSSIQPMSSSHNREVSTTLVEITATDYEGVTKTITSPAFVSTSTTTINGEVTIITTWCPLDDTSSERPSISEISAQSTEVSPSPISTLNTRVSQSYTELSSSTAEAHISEGSSSSSSSSHNENQSESTTSDIRDESSIISLTSSRVTDITSVASVTSYRPAPSSVATTEEGVSTAHTTWNPRESTDRYQTYSNEESTAGASVSKSAIDSQTHTQSLSSLVLSTVTSTLDGTITEYTTWCPIVATELDKISYETYKTVTLTTTTCSNNICTLSTVETTVPESSHEVDTLTKSSSQTSYHSSSTAAYSCTEDNCATSTRVEFSTSHREQGESSISPSDTDQEVFESHQPSDSSSYSSSASAQSDISTKGTSDTPESFITTISSEVGTDVTPTIPTDSSDLSTSHSFRTIESSSTTSISATTQSPSTFINSCDEKSCSTSELRATSYISQNTASSTFSSSVSSTTPSITESCESGTCAISKTDKTPTDDVSTSKYHYCEGIECSNPVSGFSEASKTASSITSELNINSSFYLSTVTTTTEGAVTVYTTWCPIISASTTITPESCTGEGCSTTSLQINSISPSGATTSARTTTVTESCESEDCSTSNSGTITTAGGTLSSNAVSISVSLSEVISGSSGDVPPSYSLSTITTTSEGKETVYTTWCTPIQTAKTVTNEEETYKASITTTASDSYHSSSHPTTSASLTPSRESCDSDHCSEPTTSTSDIISAPTSSVPATASTESCESEECSGLSIEETTTSKKISSTTSTKTITSTRSCLGDECLRGESQTAASSAIETTVSSAVCQDKTCLKPSELTFTASATTSACEGKACSIDEISSLSKTDTTSAAVSVTTVTITSTNSEGRSYTSTSLSLQFDSTIIDYGAATRDGSQTTTDLKRSTVVVSQSKSTSIAGVPQSSTSIEQLSTFSGKAANLVIDKVLTVFLILAII